MMIINIDPSFLWAGFLVLLVYFVIMSVILNYHWGHYGMNDISKKVARVSYFFVSIVLLSAIAFFIGYYSF